AAAHVARPSLPARRRTSRSARRRSGPRRRPPRPRPGRAPRPRATSGRRAARAPRPAASQAGRRATARARSPGSHAGSVAVLLLLPISAAHVLLFLVALRARLLVLFLGRLR